MRSGSTVSDSELGSAGTTTSTSSWTSAAPITTHDTSYSPASVAVTVSAVVVVPAPNGDSASACAIPSTGLSNASNARQVTSTGSPATATELASWVTTRTGGPGRVRSSSGVSSTSPSVGAA